MSPYQYRLYAKCLNVLIFSFTNSLNYYYCSLPHKRNLMLNQLRLGHQAPKGQNSEASQSSFISELWSFKSYYILTPDDQNENTIIVFLEFCLTSPLSFPLSPCSKSSTTSPAAQPPPNAFLLVLCCLTLLSLWLPFSWIWF